MVFSRVTDRVKRKRKKKRPIGLLRAFGEVLALAPLAKRIVVIGGLFISSIFELLGLTMIIPLLAAASLDHHASKGGISTAIRSGMEVIGLPFDPFIILVLIVAGLLPRR